MCYTKVSTPTLMYGSKIWVWKEIEIEKVEMDNLKVMIGVRRRGIIGNERISVRKSVYEYEVIYENMMIWYRFNEKNEWK